ncbi:M9 family metallopeptidase [Pleionea sp. CnH1-48]|uniref:M9 family metallopeptidase n=1 Tax=Pleionea sp. CnH1-48 TaxID=2954494 RepID=UPI002098123F|nr:M9 family metallopeptidase [Pleionea sp. CnH1-48]MCO7223498.1 M9 family metallopeptidase [Pleionea sp. CnH1-48]
MNMFKSRGLVGVSMLLMGASFSIAAKQHAPVKHSSQHIKPQIEVEAPVEPMYHHIHSKHHSHHQKVSIKATCDMNGFATKTGSALVSHIRNADTECLNNLFTANTTSFAAFQANKMLDVANATATLASQYSATNGPNDIGNLYLFLRTGYYIQFYNPDDVPAYGNNVTQAVTRALDNLVGNGDFYAASDQHGKNINDAIILMDSAGLQHRYIPAAKEWLNRWNQDAAQHWYMRNAVNSFFTMLFRGHWNDQFVAAIADDYQLVELLAKFAQQDWMLTHDALFMQENAAGELTRILQHKQAAVYSTVKARTKTILQRYSMTGTGASVWLRAAGNADYYDDCAEFNICGFKEQLEQQILSVNHSCSSTIKVRAQEMNSSELNDSCQKLSVQETFFHSMLETNNTPVADDHNEDLEVVVFDDYDNYNTYAGLFFGISTNNGGMYLEGDPSDVNNQARFIAHEASWLRPEFEVWNLTHEYVHYLDGRFNLKGDFADARTSSHKTVWWIEGLAEYISKKNRNDSAIEAARTQAFPLSTIMSNDYNSGQNRVYTWGYLAVRFMFEKHRGEVDQMLAYFRAGNYDNYLSYINSIGTSYDAEWNAWLQTVESNDDIPGNGGGGGGTDAELQNGVSKTGIAVDEQNGEVHFYIEVPEGATDLKFEINDGTGDADLYVKRGSQPTASDYDCRPWKNGNQESCEFATPVSDRWYVMLRAYNPFAGVTLTASFTPPSGGGVDACANSSGITYGNVELNTPTCVAGSNALQYFYTYVEADTSQLVIELNNGSGNGDLYVKDASWATVSDYDQRSTGATNSERIVVNSPTEGWYYVSVAANPEYGDTTLTISSN